MAQGKIMYFPEKKDFFKEQDELIRPGDVVLVKASRGMELEEIVESILEDKE